MSSSINNLNEQNFISAIEKINIPDWNLSNVNYLEFFWKGYSLYIKYSLTGETIEINTSGDIKHKVKEAISELFEDIEHNINMGGCYWLWTNEPIHHYLHTHKTPETFDGGEVIYNGISDKGLFNRVLHHLFGNENQAWSGIGIDIYKNKPKSHFKKACSPKGKIPVLKTESGDYRGLDYVEMLYDLNLSSDELDYIRNNKKSNTFFFRNGICLTDDKHKGYTYRVYFTPGETETYRNHIESSWRNSYGLPRLCSYIKR